MRLFISFSSYLFLVVLSFSLIITGYISNNRTEINTGAVDTRIDRYFEPETAVNTSDELARTSSMKSNKKSGRDFVWRTISNDLQLDHKTETRAVRTEIQKILSEKGKFENILKSAAPYIYFIYEQTEQHHLPAEIALIPIIESEFNPNDYSKKGATGLWQLMPRTASELGVRVKGGYDGRRNVIASTKAALAYFKDLGGQFKGNWYLAVAAYDAGQGKVASAVRHAGSTNFLNLKLPKETKLYVPKLLAVAEIISHPEKYHVALPRDTNMPYFAQLKTKTPVNLMQLAKASGIDLKTLQTLNPDYKNGKVPAKGPYTLLVPIEEMNAVKKRLGTKLVTI